MLRPPSGTVFPHLYALLTVLLVLGLSSRLTCSQDICSRSTVAPPIPLNQFFARYKFVTYLLTYLTCFFYLKVGGGGKMRTKTRSRRVRPCTKECVFLHLVLLYETANMNMKMYKDVGVRSILLVSCQTS